VKDPEPIAKLTQVYGPFTAEWSLYDGHLEVETRTPFGHSYVPIALSRLDGFSFESGPLPILVALATASLVVATAIALGTLFGAGGLGAVFLSSTLAAFLVTTCRLTRHERVVIHTVGARRFVLYAGLSPAPERDRFLHELERVRMHGEAGPVRPGPRDDEPEDVGPDLDEPAEPESPTVSGSAIDRRWIN
jgi:hypothetical protein